MAQVPVAPVLADVQDALNPQQLPRPALQQIGQPPTPNAAQPAAQQAILPAAPQEIQPAPPNASQPVTPHAANPVAQQAVQPAAQNVAQAAVVLAVLAPIQVAEQAVVQAASQPELVGFLHILFKFITCRLVLVRLRPRGLPSYVLFLVFSSFYLSPHLIISKDLKNSPTVAAFKTKIRKLNLSDYVDNNSNCCKLCCA